jgi:hypothetical protein
MGLGSPVAWWLKLQKRTPLPNFANLASHPVEVKRPEKETQWLTQRNVETHPVVAFPRRKNAFAVPNVRLPRDQWRLFVNVGIQLARETLWRHSVRQHHLVAE